MRKPICVYIESSRTTFCEDNPFRDGLCYFIREDCGYDVIQYEWVENFEKDIEQFKKSIKLNQLLVVIVKHYEGMNQYEIVQKIVREQLSATLPIIIIPGRRIDKTHIQLQDQFVHIFYDDAPEFIDFLNQLRAAWQPPCNWLGAETEIDQARLMKQLESVYRKHYDDDNLLGTPDQNHMIVAEALRIKLLPASLLKTEFDDAIEMTPPEFTATQKSIYEKEMEKIRQMDEKERSVFKRDIFWERGCELFDTGSAYIRSASCGPNVSGFAIDPVTLESQTTTGLGMHYVARQMLARRVERIEQLKRRVRLCELNREEIRNCKRRLAIGLIFHKMDGFSTPILQLLEYQSDTIEKVVRFLKEEKKFIPVDVNGKLLEG